VINRERWLPWGIALVGATTVYAIALALTGGFRISVAGVRLSSHSWERPAAVAAIGAIALVIATRAQIVATSRTLAVGLESPLACLSVVGAAAIWTVAIGISCGTFANGGADSYGYVGQARLLAQGRLTDTIPVSREYQWPNVDYTLTPLGFTKGRHAGEISPMYPPGLPLILAPFSALSERAIYIVVPMFGVLLIWLTYRLGVLSGDGLAGASAALLLAVSPTFLYQLVQPMSDVPCAACWLAALVVAARGSPSAAAASGVLSSIAILIRPNLAPLAVIVGGLVVCARASARGRQTAYFVASILPGLVLLGWIQAVRYGSPFASGYGTASDVFALAYVVPNLARYPRWMTESHTPFIWLALGAPFWIVRRATHPRLAWAALLLSLAVWLAYLPYMFFQRNEWFYTRFLLPAIPIMLFFAVACALAGVRALPPVWRFPVAVIVTISVGAASLWYADRHGAFDIRNQERKYPLAGEYVRTRGPANAFVLASQHSGSIRYYSGRPILRWDLLSPTRLDQALATFRAQGYEPILVVDTGEYQLFRERFEGTGQRAVHQLTPLAVIGDTRVFAFR
jgi:4-amino-4-deoxy-L-arabinose transferase-like glycosyltransferase